jgi:hypothetical protein
LNYIRFNDSVPIKLDNYINSKLVILNQSKGSPPSIFSLILFFAALGFGSINQIIPSDLGLYTDVLENGEPICSSLVPLEYLSVQR